MMNISTGGMEYWLSEKELSEWLKHFDRMDADSIKPRTVDIEAAEWGSLK